MSLRWADPSSSGALPSVYVCVRERERERGSLWSDEKKKLERYGDPLIQVLQRTCWKQKLFNLGREPGIFLEIQTSRKCVVRVSSKNLIYFGRGSILFCEYLTLKVAFNLSDIWYWFEGFHTHSYRPGTKPTTNYLKAVQPKLSICE